MAVLHLTRRIIADVTAVSKRILMRQLRARLGMLAFGVAVMSACNSAPTQETASRSGEQPQPSASSATAQPPAAAEDEVVARARKALRNAGVEEAEYQLAAREEAQWSDSSLGCPRPGLSYMQVITQGEVLRFTGPRGSYEVHVSSNGAVLCAPRVLGTPKGLRNARTRNLDKVVDDAREDLHAKLGVETKDVRLIGMTPTDWPDSSLGCPGVTADLHEPVTGYKLLLSARGQQYIYHTDLQRTFACPPIEEQ
jgi:hypothetical protein